MAKKRMLAIDFIESDNFNRLTPTLQALYLHLIMNADDDGFVTNPKGVARSLGYKLETLRRLVDTGYIIEFESGVVVISHWLIHNQIRKDRYVKTRCTEEFARLYILVFPLSCLDAVDVIEDIQTGKFLRTACLNVPILAYLVMYKPV